MDTPLVVENPDGPIYIAVKEYNQVKPDNYHVMVGDQISHIDLPLLYDHEAEIAKGITIVDFVLNIMNLWFFFEPLFGFLAFVSCFGYRGVDKYHSGMLIVYLFYQYMLTIGKGVMIYMTIDQHLNSKSIIFISVATAVQMWITYSIQKFYNKISTT
jgi:hypothetical protein|tara:strand:- start:372 stop:842 length:471 start_codon:yes stop_codon:yes gene_type:complete